MRSLMNIALVGLARRNLVSLAQEHDLNSKVTTQVPGSPAVGQRGAFDGAMR